MMALSSWGTYHRFNGWGVTVVDSLDTMWLMGLKEEFELGVTMVANTTFASKVVSLPAPPFHRTHNKICSFTLLSRIDFS